MVQKPESNYLQMYTLAIAQAPLEKGQTID